MNKTLKSILSLVLCVCFVLALSACGKQNNDKLRSAEVLLCEDGTHRLIRRAETPRDYFATLDFLPLMKPLFED